MKLIEIIFTGLIALVPNRAEDPSRLTAYLVPEGQHVPQLKVYGNAEIVPPLGSFACQQAGHIIKCDLKNIDLELLGAAGMERRSLRKKLRKSKPETQAERELLDWLVRMGDVRSRAGKIFQDKEVLERFVGRGFEFGWDSARVTHLDGEELGSVIPLIGFRPRKGSDSDLKQAVAEGVNFTSRAVAPVVLRLTNRLNGEELEIKVKCGDASTCLSINVDNSLEHQPCMADYDGDHFLAYYALVRSPGNPEGRMRPYRIERRECPRHGPWISESLFDAWLRLIEPAVSNKELVDKIRREAPERPVRLADLEVFLVNLFTQNYLIISDHYAPSQLNIIISFLKIQDRAVCPPVLLDP